MYNMYSNMECKLCKAKPWLLIQAIRRREKIDDLIIKPKSISCGRTAIVSLYRKKQWFSVLSLFSKVSCSWLESQGLFLDLSFAAAFAWWKCQPQDSSCCFGLHRSGTRCSKFWKRKPKFVFNSSKSSCGKPIPTKVIRINGRKAWDSRLGMWFWAGGLASKRQTSKR